MTTLLIHRQAHARIAAELPADLPIAFLSAQDPAPVFSEDEPVIGWLDSSLFSNGDFALYYKALMGAPRLDWVHSGAAGFDHPMFQSIVRRGVRFSTSHGQATGIAEYVLAAVLALFKDEAGRRADQAAHRWARASRREIAGTTWVLVGFGAIGQAVAQRARAFGARIVAVRRTQAAHPLADAVVPPERLAEVASSADVMVLSCPLSRATRRIVDARIMAVLPQNAVLVNVGRGGLIEESALPAALDAGRPAHAVLDVFETEPLPPESPLWDHPRIVITPHDSPVTNGLAARNDAEFVAALRAYLAGGPIPSEVSAAEVLEETD
jgi:phosphoglycerate dehydrogenase-like enzyme